MGARGKHKHKANMIETQTTVNPPKQEVPNKDSERFPGEGKKCGEVVEVEELDYSDMEFDNYEHECPICRECGCDSNECELEIERQEYMAEYWADF